MFDIKQKLWKVLETNMQKKVSTILPAAIFVIFSLVFSVKETSAQCGPDGTQLCPEASTVPANKRPVSNASKLRAESAERRRAELARLKRKQLKNQNAKNPPPWMKNIIEYGKSFKNGQPLEIFPTANVTLGKTGSKLLALRGDNCGITGKDGKLTQCYVVEGITFYCDENNISDSLYLTRLRLGAMPDNWIRAGFDWELSYNGWVNLFKQMGYESLATEKPSVAVQSGKKFLKAELMTVVNTPAGKVQIILDFNFGVGKTTVNDKGTLFSIAIDKFN